MRRKTTRRRRTIETFEFIDCICDFISIINISAAHLIFFKNIFIFRVKLGYQEQCQKNNVEFLPSTWNR